MLKRYFTIAFAGTVLISFGCSQAMEEDNFSPENYFAFYDSLQKHSNQILEIELPSYPLSPKPEKPHVQSFFSENFETTQQNTQSKKRTCRGERTRPQATELQTILSCFPLSS